MIEFDSSVLQIFSQAGYSDKKEFDRKFNVDATTVIYGMGFLGEKFADCLIETFPSARLMFCVSGENEHTQDEKHGLSVITPIMLNGGGGGGHCCIDFNFKFL
jgi:hypothetical protein